MVQLWVNLPAKDKTAKPGYQTLLDADIPVVELPDDAGKLRVIAGSFGGAKGPARTFTPINIWDVRLARGKTATLDLPEGHTLSVLVLAGTVEVNGEEIAREAQTVLLDRNGGGITLEANSDAKLLVLTGEPIDEPVVAHGPFVMNTVGEIKQAMLEFQAGKLRQDGRYPNALSVCGSGLPARSRTFLRRRSAAANADFPPKAGASS